MKPAFLTLLLVLSVVVAGAQEVPVPVVGKTPQGFDKQFDSRTKLLSFGLGFPNLHRISYNEPKGYTHIKTSGFGPFYARFEFAAFQNLGLAASFAYSTFHYSYYGLSSFPSGPQQVIFYDDVNTLNISLSANYHFGKWITNPRLDAYAGLGLSASYLKSRYGNIPPYRSPETNAEIYPLVRAGARYYLNPIFSLYGEAGYDGLSIIQLGFSVKF
jgi:hypothetical protein